MLLSSELWHHAVLIWIDVSEEHRFIYGLHGAISKKMATFINTAARTSNPTASYQGQIVSKARKWLAAGSKQRCSTTSWSVSYSLPCSRQFLVWFTIWPWTWTQCVPPKHQLAFTALHDITPQHSKASCPFPLLGSFQTSCPNSQPCVCNSIQSNLFINSIDPI
jgi:hypothetical protein